MTGWGCAGSPGPALRSSRWRSACWRKSPRSPASASGTWTRKYYPQCAMSEYYCHQINVQCQRLSCFRLVINKARVWGDKSSSNRAKLGLTKHFRFKEATSEGHHWYHSKVSTHCGCLNIIWGPPTLTPAPAQKLPIITECPHPRHDAQCSVTSCIAQIRIFFTPPSRASKYFCWHHE